MVKACGKVEEPSPSDDQALFGSILKSLSGNMFSAASGIMHFSFLIALCSRLFGKGGSDVESSDVLSSVDHLQQAQTVGDKPDFEKELKATGKGGEEDSQEACLTSVDRPGEGKREWDRQCQATDGNVPTPFGQQQFNYMEPDVECHMELVQAAQEMQTAGSCELVLAGPSMKPTPLFQHGLQLGEDPMPLAAVSQEASTNGEHEPSQALADINPAVVSATKQDSWKLKPEEVVNEKEGSNATSGDLPVGSPEDSTHAAEEGLLKPDSIPTNKDPPRAPKEPTSTEESHPPPTKDPPFTVAKDSSPVATLGEKLGKGMRVKRLDPNTQVSAAAAETSASALQPKFAPPPNYRDSGLDTMRTHFYPTPHSNVRPEWDGRSNKKV